VRLVDQWREIEDALPEGWDEARLVVTVEDEGLADRGAALLGPINPGRHGKRLHFFAARGGRGPSPDTVRRRLQRLDSERIMGTLELVATESHADAEPELEPPTLAEGWDALVAGLPEDWSDLYGEIELTSTDYLERAALLLAPLNPSRFSNEPALRFRSARRFGYGASPQMVRRSLERLDAEGIRGEVRILWAVSDTDPVETQGPVWYVGGRAV
jgi:hypothetical protein